jgi:hypothetical protein
VQLLTLGVALRRVDCDSRLTLRLVGPLHLNAARTAGQTRTAHKPCTGQLRGSTSTCERPKRAHGRPFSVCRFKLWLNYSRYTQCWPVQRRHAAHTKRQRRVP